MTLLLLWTRVSAYWRYVDVMELHWSEILKTDTTEVQKIISDYQEKSCANKPNNLEEVDKFLETHRLPRLNYEETESLNTLVTGKEINPIIKNLPQTKVQDQVASLVNSIKNLKNNQFQSFTNSLSKEQSKEYLQTHFMSPALL